MMITEEKFDCSMRNRIVFCKNDKIYEIKELDDQFCKKHIEEKILLINRDRAQLLFTLKDLEDKLQISENSKERRKIRKYF
jgi:hypothetical protein